MVDRGKLVKVGATALLVLAVVGIAYSRWPGAAYEVKFVTNSAAQLFKGNRVLIDGFKVGSVTDIAVRDGKAVVTVGVNDAQAPLHTGTTGRIEWYSALGERSLVLNPGPRSNPEIPNGAMYRLETVQVEVDEVLSALDEPTRARLSSMIKELNKTSSGREQNIQATLRSSGPAVNALGEMLEGLGRDGPAIKRLVGQLENMIAVTARRQDDVRGVVTNLSGFSANVAAQQGELTRSLRRLPGTLRTAETTLDKVPAASDSATALLDDLQPATAELPEAARNLSPVLQDLQPTVAQLRPMLESAYRLLGRTPGLLDASKVVLPGATKTLDRYQPAVSFLRPYTPEAVGGIYNFGQTFAPYDSQGHLFGAVLGNAGPLAFNESVVTPPPIEKNSEPRPGSPVGQPWKNAHDATGSAIG